MLKGFENNLKGGKCLESLAENIMKELNCETVFTVPVFNGIGVSESIVVTWFIMGVLVALSILFTRNLKIENIGKRQLILETAIVGLQNIIGGIIGKEGIKYVPYLETVIIYIGLSNIIGLFGLKPPTKDLNVTAGLALMSILLIEWAGLQKKGVKNWLKSFTRPVPIITPINILEVFIRPLSLCMRLFGNVIGAFVVMELLKMIVPPILPIPFSLYFDIFDGFIQAYVFVFLTSLFIKETIE